MYVKNMEALKKHYPDVYNKIKGMVDYNDSVASVELAKNGEPIIKYPTNNRDIYLNSRYNPSKEAGKYVEEYIDMPDHSLLIAYGLSNGSYVRAYLENVKKNTICVVYEPSADLFMKVIHEIDITDLIESNRVHIAIEGLNDNTLSYILEKRISIYNKEANKYMAAPYYIDLYPDNYRKFKKILIDIHEKFYIVTNTAIKYGKDVAHNNIKNMKYLKGCRSGVDFIGKFPKDMPAVVVAAGPSLDKNITLLKELKGKALILVVDTAIARVQKAGIMPDMIVSIDMGKPVDMFEGEGVSKFPFLACMDSNVEVFDYLKPENLIFCGSDSIVWDRLFKEAGSEIVSINDGGSVATAAISILIQWGFKKIIIMGMDLGFTDNKLYAGTDSQDIEIDEDRYTHVDGIGGGQVLVRKDYYIYLKWVEKIAGQFSDIEFIDATEGGAKKKNTKIMTLREAIDTYCQKEYIITVDQIVEQVPRLFVGEKETLIAEALEGMRHNLNSLNRQLKSCASDCRRGKIILERGENNIKELKRINMSISKMDDKLDEAEERVYLEKYMTYAQLEMLKDMFEEEEDHIKESIRMYEKSRIYYEAMSEGIPEIVKIIDDCLEELKNQL